jgi:hypothetical protein
LLRWGPEWAAFDLGHDRRHGGLVCMTTSINNNICSTLR